MQLLAAVDADGTDPLVETLVERPARLRRGMTAVVITAVARPGLGPAARRPPRHAGVACVVVLLDAPAFARYADGTAATDPGALSLSAPTRRRGR